jgi:hypothetical protein
MAFPRALASLAYAVPLVFIGVSRCPAEPLRVLDSQEVDLGPRSIIYNRVVTPVLKSTPVPTPAIVTPEAPPTAAELEEMQRLESKRYAYAFLSCTVYDHEFTEVEWYEDGQWVSFLTTIDFHYLSQLSDFETADSLYSFFMGLGDCSREDFEGTREAFIGENKFGFHPRPWPFGLLQRQQQTGKSAWQITAKSPASKEVMQAIDDLHRYFDANRDNLIRECKEIEAARLAQEQWLKEHPPLPKDSVVEFFPIHSRHAPDRLGLKPISQQLLR